MTDDEFKHRRRAQLEEVGGINERIAQIVTTLAAVVRDLKSVVGAMAELQGRILDDVDEGARGDGET